tara:strand:- start:762 stop:1190 length:429 start_codon:yes stop_codon:yes gene_type:complete
MKELIDIILTLRKRWLDKFDGLNKMPKEKQTYLDGHYSGHINAYTDVLTQIDHLFPNGYKDQEYLKKANKEIQHLKEQNEELKNKLKKRARQFNDSTDRLQETIRSKCKDIQAIELERDRTEDKYSTLHELLVKATKIGLNK